MASAESPGCRRISSSIWCSMDLKPAFAIRENRSGGNGSAQTLVVHRSARRRRKRFILRSLSSSSFSSSYINPVSGSDRGMTMGVGRKGGPMTAAEDEDIDGKGDAREPEEGDPSDTAGGSEDAGKLQEGSSGIVSVIEEALPTKDLVTLASCVVGLLTGVGVVLFNQVGAADRADLIHRNAGELSSKDLEDWQTSMELLETSKLEMDIEAKLISDARSALDSSIEDLVKDDRQEVEGLRKKRATLAKDLDELLNLVRLKESEIAENESLILEAERKISEVAWEFQETSSSIETKHDNLKSSLSRIDSEREILSSKKNEIDEFVSLEEQKCFNLRELANVALDEAKAYQDSVRLRKELASSITKSREDKVQLVKTEETILEEIQLLRQQISSARTKLQELSSIRVSIQQDIDSFKQRIAFVDKRGPELEAEKKVAAAARNFKEAGRIAAEAKTLNSEKESMRNKMDQAVLNLEKVDGDIKNNISMMQVNEELVLLKEKEAAVASFKRLQLISAAARSERSTALELGDLEEGEFLLKEAEAAEERARELQGTYNLNPEDHGNTRKYLSPVALITKFSGHSLAEIAASLKQPMSDE